MKILVVDDSLTQRRILEHVLKSNFECEVSQACDGADALAAIECDPPNLVILDCAMPIVDGIETLRAIRSNPSFAALPVVVASGVTNRAKVGAMIDLGISEYLAKPIVPSVVAPRLRRVIEEVSAGMASPPKAVEEPASDAADTTRRGERPTLLFVEPDAAFRTLVRPVLQELCEVTSLESAGAVLELADAEAFDLALISSDLPLLRPGMLVKRLRATSGGRCRFFLLTSGPQAMTEDEAKLFDGVVKRSTAAAKFSAELHEKLLADREWPDIGDLVGVLLQAELSVVIRQALGVTCFQEMAHCELDAEVRGTDKVTASVDLQSDLPGSSLRVDIFLSELDAQSLAETIFGEAPEKSLVSDFAGEMANIVAGRVRASLETQGVLTVEGLPRLNEMPVGDDSERLFSMRAATDAGHSIGLAVSRLHTT